MNKLHHNNRNIVAGPPLVVENYLLENLILIDLVKCELFINGPMPGIYLKTIMFI